MTKTEKSAGWRLTAIIALPLMGLISRITVRGTENIPASGGFILAPCHFSAIDPVVMGVALWRAGRTPRFMAKESLFRVPVLGSVLRGLGQIPVDRAGQQRAMGPMKAARSLAKSGGGIVVYPEGSLTRDPDLWPMRGKTGAVRMALDADIPLIPAAHWGTQILMPRYSGRIRFFPPTPITVIIGKPIDLSAFKGKVLDQKLLTAATEILMTAIAELQGQLRGEKPPTKRWDPVEHNQTTTGKFKMTTVAVLGAGAWGTTFAKVLADGGAEVKLWARRDEIAREINETHRNSTYLQRVNLPANITASTSLTATLAGVDEVYLSVPSQSLRSVLDGVDGHLGDSVPVVSLMKGVERESGLRMSEVIRAATGIDEGRIAVVSGPNLALELAKEEPTASAVSSTNPDTAVMVAATCRNSYFTTLINTDVIGTEFGGVLKNLIAVAVGIADGVGYGDNTKASIITRGLAELSAFASAYGARPETMWGLAGLGDLIATCESPLSRNNTAGRLLGQGYSFDRVIRQMDQTAEGLSSVDPILVLAGAKGVSMPIVSQVQQVLKGTLDPRELAPHLATDSEIPSEE